MNGWMIGWVVRGRDDGWMIGLVVRRRDEWMDDWKAGGQRENKCVQVCVINVSKNTILIKGYDDRLLGCVSGFYFMF